MKLINISKTYKNKLNKVLALDNISLDIDYKGDNLGLIKIDTEGFETQIIQGATELIKKYKPVLDIAIYHRPEDFFELKNKLLAINHDYKFMIRRSEQMIPTADLVLIAY